LSKLLIFLGVVLGLTDIAIGILISSTFHIIAGIVLLVLILVIVGACPLLLFLTRSQKEKQDISRFMGGRS
jgi:hypothetical protein